MERGKEKRQSPRMQLQSPLRYHIIPTDTAGYLNAAVQDISLTGFRFHSQEFIPKQASIILEMNLLGYAPVRSLARAVWVRAQPGDGGFEVGGIFVEPPHGARTTLNKLISG
jgi:hypothetical protein